MNRNYPAFIIKDDDSFTVSFPDLPGCLTFGPSIEEAFDCAREALEGHLAVLVDEHMPIPEATPLDEVHPDDDDKENVVTKVLVPVLLPGKTVRTNISIDESLLMSIDLVTQNRSAFFAEAARNELARRRAGRMAEH
jgi:predicted RNase H-like HicB family nuclease